MSAMITLLNVENYPKYSNIWDMNKVLADQFYNEILSGNRTTFVYSIDNEYVAEISLVYDMKDIDYTISNKRAYVSRLIVKKEYRRKGIGKELIRFIKSEAIKQGLQELSIGVDLDNFPALKLYIASGFNKIIHIGKDEQGEFVKLLCSL